MRSINYKKNSFGINALIPTLKINDLSFGINALIPLKINDLYFIRNSKQNDKQNDKPNENSSFELSSSPNPKRPQDEDKKKDSKTSGTETFINK